MEALSDRDLLAAARRGEQKAWATLVARHGDALQRTAFAVLGSRDLAADVAQECFLRLLRRDPPCVTESLRGYLATAAWRLAIKESQRHRRVCDWEPLPEPAGSQQSDQRLLTRERDHHLGRALEQLPEPQRQVIVLRLVAGLSVEETAEQLSIPPGTVKSRLYHAVQSIRERLRKEGLHPWNI